MVTYVLLILNAGYSTALFTSIAALVILLVYRGENAIPAIILLLLIFGAGLLALLYWTGFRNLLLDFFDGTAVAKKINDLVSSSDTGEAEGSIASRIRAYSNTLGVIRQYPIVGAFWNSNGGGHSAILDIFAKYGVVGGYIYCKCIFSSSFNLKKTYTEDVKVARISNACFCSILFVCLLNSAPFEFMVPVILLIPAVIKNVADWNESESD